MTSSLRKAAQLLILGTGIVSTTLATAALNPRLAGSLRESPTTTTDRLIIKYRSGDAPLPTARAEASLRTAGNRQGVRTSHLRRMANGAHVFQFNRRMSREEASIVAQSMRDGDPNVEYAEPDLLLQTSQSTWAPVDPLYNQQWALTNTSSGIRAPGAWATTRGAGVVVAVIDTGVRPHADLRANLLPGVDFISDTKIANDGNGRDGDAADPGDAVAAGFCGSGTAARSSSWHGTHVAGIVAALGNTTGVVGVAPLAKILPLRALGRCGGYTSDVADAVTWAAGGAISGISVNATPAKVINLSLGGSGTCSATMQTAIQSARSRGAVVVVSAGNSNVNASQATPANCAGVITVAATGKGGGKASYSNFGTTVSLAAPGGDSSGGILSTLNAGTSTPGADNYVNYMGTSMAAPAVSGVAALMLSAKPSLTPDQVASLLKSTATPFPAACSGCGSGIVNAAAAVAAAAHVASPAPAPAPAPVSSTSTSATTTGKVNEVEPNNSLAQAQALSGNVQVSGKLASGDLDHFRLTLAPGKKLTAAVTPGTTTAAGLGVYLTTGQQLVMLTGAKGATRQVTVTNSGSSAVTVVLRVVFSGGAAGAYTLSVKP